MTTEIWKTPGGELSLCRLEPGERPRDLSDFMGLLWGAPAECLVLRREELPAAFYDLTAGVAGEFLQKVADYRRRLVILGDFSPFEGSAFGRLIAESNRFGRIVFAADREEALRYL